MSFRSLDWGGGATEIRKSTIGCDLGKSQMTCGHVDS